MPEHPTEELTVDQLAERTATSVRTIRFYAGRGLLPPPRLRGRTGLYDDRHVARLDLVGELTGLGFTLAAIERYLERIPLDADLDTLILHRALLTPWVPERGEDVDLAELYRRAGRPLDDDTVAALEALGLLEMLPDDRVDLRGPLGPELEAVGRAVPAALLREMHALVTKHTDALADDLMALYQRDVLQPFRDAGHPAAERRRLADMITRLKPLILQGVMTAFGRAVNRTIREAAG